MDGSHRKSLAEAAVTAFALAPEPTPGVIARGSRFRVRSPRLDPGGATALQSHLHRAQHRVLVEGTAEVTLDRRSRLVGAGEAVHIPVGQPHRLENPGRLPVTLIAAETGCYLGMDDVIRHDQTLLEHFMHSSEAPRSRREECTTCIDQQPPGSDSAKAPGPTH